MRVGVVAGRWKSVGYWASKVAVNTVDCAGKLPLAGVEVMYTHCSSEPVSRVRRCVVGVVPRDCVTSYVSSDAKVHVPGVVCGVVCGVPGTQSVGPSSFTYVPSAAN